MMSARPSEAAPVALPEGRRQERTHLFLGAVLCSKAGSCPVHVRNISSTGALIEGSIVPEVGDELVLKRGGLEASARIVWKAGRKAGIAFDAIIYVVDWITNRTGPHQDRVDDVIRSIRSGSASPSVQTDEHRSIPPAAVIAAELEALKSHLADLEHGLTADVVVVATHPEIQLLDVALQSVERLLQKLRQQ